MRRLLMIALAVALAVTGVTLVRAQVDRPGPTYPLWEYRVETTREPGTRELSDANLNSLGREGWELTGLTRREIRVQDMIQTETVYVFKRSRGEARR
jgi:hypothetical protein